MVYYTTHQPLSFEDAPANSEPTLDSSQSSLHGFSEWAHHPLPRPFKLNRLACEAHQIAAVRERALRFLVRHPDSLDLCFYASVFEAPRLVANKILHIHYKGPTSSSHSSRIPIAVLIGRRPPGAQTWCFLTKKEIRGF
ncbi:hypothetical protein AC579_6496 [Pseudocercospora musae]|uniref:Uncharacterized protein n=1 Tax=Pseudocercospora musae TaxID=113226 RepID=A0A139I0I4_9PEZI|nr:hypothetical protein AC579_6496 [Pseudocercospora musae]